MHGYNVVQENHSGSIFEIGISWNTKCDNLVGFPKSGHIWIQGQQKLFITGQAKLDPQDYTIKCVGGWYCITEYFVHIMRGRQIILCLLICLFYPNIICQTSPKITLELLFSTYLLFIKMDFRFILRKTGPAKTRAARPFPPALGY